MTHPMHPCRRDCPRHHTYCRKSCPEWQKYEAEMTEFNTKKHMAVYAGNSTVGREKMVEHIRKERCACV